MAKSLNRESPLDLLEAAVSALRQAGLGALALHWAGSVPFALVALLFWKLAGNARTSDLTCAFGALALAISLVWMNCWRAVFAVRLRRQLGGISASRRARAGLFHLIAVESLACGTKLVVLPFAALIVFPLPTVIAFYRNMAVLADGSSTGLRGTIARARQLARFQPEQTWLLIPLLCFLWLVVAANVGAALGLLPQAVRILFGYESTFSRSGIHFLANPMFAMLVLAVTWLLFDPFVQTIYCIRCYAAESLETGEDIRAGLRGLPLARPIPATMKSAASMAIAAVIAACLTLMTVPCRADVQMTALDQASQRALRAPEYDWRLPPPPAAVRNTPWIILVTDRILDSSRSVTDAIGNLLGRFFKWLGEKLSLGGEQSNGGTLPSRGLHWTVYLAIALVVATGIFMAFRALRSRRPKAEPVPGGDSPTIRPDADDLAPDRLPEEQWLEMAERLLLEENLRHALRAFYLASLAWMGRAGFIATHPGKTNREYEQELKRRLRTFPEAWTLFSTNVAAFECAWYGLHDVAMGEIDEFRGRVARMKTLLPAARELAA